MVSDVPAFTSSHELFVVFSPSVFLRRGSKRATWWAPGGKSRSIHYIKLVKILPFGSKWPGLC